MANELNAHAFLQVMKETSGRPHRPHCTPNCFSLLLNCCATPDIHCPSLWSTREREQVIEQGRPMRKKGPLSQQKQQHQPQQKDKDFQKRSQTASKELVAQAGLRRLSALLCWQGRFWWSDSHFRTPEPTQKTWTFQPFKAQALNAKWDKIHVLVSP